MGCTPVPATTDILCKYAAMLARSLKYNSVKQYMNIIRILHLEWDLPNPLLDNFRLRCVMQGIRRDVGDFVCRKLPMTPCLLRQVLSQLDLSRPLDILVWAACLVLFYAMLRRSNLLPISSTAVCDSSRHLRRGDITFHPWGISLRINWSKTIQFKQRILTVPLPRFPGSVLCPVSALFQAMRLSVGAPLDSAVLTMPRSQGFTPLTSHMFTARLHDCLRSTVTDPTLYNTHSFRRGGASWAYKCGVNVETIRQIGDWRSDCFRDYLTIDSSSLLDATRSMLFLTV